MFAQQALNSNSLFHFFGKSVKGSLIGILLVPVFYVCLNPHVSLAPQYMAGLWMSTRIGLAVVIANFLFMILLYSAIYRWNPSSLWRLLEHIKFRFAVGFVGMLLGLIAASYTEPLFGGERFGIAGVTSGLLIGGITYLAFLLLSAFRSAQTQNLKLRAESAEATMNVLKNQMQPHFLFNSLNSLAELIDSNQHHASTMTQNLSDLYREILEASSGPMSKLEVELSIVRKYLELETLRFGQRLNYSIKQPPEARSIILPSLILQTLVENAVKHGISQSLDGGTIDLTIDRSPSDGYFVKIENTSGQATTRSPKSTGKGIENTKARLSLVYGDKHTFDIQTGTTKTVVRFWISGV